MMCMIKFKMIFQSALITSLCLLLCACRADDPETVTPEYAAQSEEPDMLPEETAKNRNKCFWNSSLTIPTMLFW